MTSLAASLLASEELHPRCVDAALESLVERARAGDRLAQRAIYDRNAPRVLRFVAEMLRDRDAARDATQETFVRVFHALASLDEPSRLVGWIYGIARRVCLEQRRALARRRTDLATAEHVQLVAENSPSPEAALAGREAAAALERALERLSADRRAVLLMRCDHQLSHEEIATAMGFSIAKVKVEIHRARAALRAALDEETTR